MGEDWFQDVILIKGKLRGKWTESELRACFWKAGTVCVPLLSLLHHLSTTVPKEFLTKRGEVTGSPETGPGIGPSKFDPELLGL